MFNAQNLAPNPSFEINFDCTYIGIESAAPWCGINVATYFNGCNSDPVFTVPTQSFSPGYPSYQMPHSGNAYASFGFIYPTQTAVSRYPHVPLIDTLVAGKIYCVTYYVSLWNDCKYSADKFGALFSALPFNCSTSNQDLYTGYTPQVLSASGVLYNDTLNWMEVSGTFTAQGTEAYLTIGNFFPNTAHTYSISYPGGVRQLSEYYLDDVSVEEVQPVICRNDTNIVLGDSVTVGANLGEANLYNWQPTAGLSCTNCPNPKASPNATTTYTVTKTQCHLTTTDVITVSVSPTGLWEAEVLEVRVRLFPNPNNGSFTLAYDLKALTEAKVNIYDISGKLVYIKTIDNLESKININTLNLNNGIYFIQLSDETKLLWTDKLVIQK